MPKKKRLLVTGYLEAEDLLKLNSLCGKFERKQSAIVREAIRFLHHEMIERPGLVGVSPVTPAELAAIERHFENLGRQK